MKSKIHKRHKETNMAVRKKLFILSAVIAASLIASKGYSQVYVSAHVGLRVPGVRVYAAPVVYTAPAPVVYDDAYYATQFPGYAYYNYPAWNGHFRDRLYYEHYRPYFERQNVGYFNHGRFENERFEREQFNRGYAGHGYANHGFADRGHNDRGSDHRGRR